MKRLAILGCTGSIGQQTLDVVRAFPETFEVVGLAAGSNIAMLEQQAREFRPRVLSFQGASHGVASRLLSEYENASLSQVATHPDVDLLMVATVGRIGLEPTLAAIRAGKTIALANKEIVVMAGEMLMTEAERCGTPLLPVDSEPSAIWQCLHGEEPEPARLIITASGGAFRDRSPDQLKQVTPDEALRHPTWTMGKKITIDSATLVNKAFEVIEAHWLFNMPWDRIDVVIHPQSIVHSLVEFVDGSVKAQLGPPDMRLPIQHALLYPERAVNPGLPRFDPLASSPLVFSPLDPQRYPCFQLVLEAGRRGGTWPTVVAAADEVAVEAFLKQHIGFLDIGRVIEETVGHHKPSAGFSLDSILESDSWARQVARQVVEGYGRTAGRDRGLPGSSVERVTG